MLSPDSEQAVIRLRIIQAPSSPTRAQGTLCGGIKERRKEGGREREEGRGEGRKAGERESKSPSAYGFLFPVLPTQ